MKAIEVYVSNRAELTKAFYAELEKRGPLGVLAVNLFRAQKRSTRAKVYRGGFKDKAYDVKQWSMERAAALLAKHGHEWGIVWGWQRDPSVKFGLADSWVLYVDLPTGQCSFHTQHPGCAPMVLYKGEWDGTKKSAEHIIAFCDLVMAQPPLEVPA